MTSATPCPDRTPLPSGDAPSTFTLAHDGSRGGGVFGPTIAIDPLFAYYTQHPLDEIARAIVARGFTAVYITRFQPETAEKERAFADAFRAAGLAPVLRIFPPTYFSIHEAHPEWRQKMLGNDQGRCDWRSYCCPNYPGFVTAYCDTVETHMRNGGYDGIQLAEIWFEQWGGPYDATTGGPRTHYACVCDACRAKFKALSGGVDPLEMLTDSKSAHYFRKPENQALYEQWVTFRVDTIQSFGKAIFDAARRANPKVVTNAMFLADATVEPGGARVYQANDLDRMVGEWKPDILTIQDAWQDWLQAGLSPDYVAAYAAAYRERIQRAHPGTFVMTHSDLGSSPASKRSYEWIQRFARITVESGLGAPSGYEWSVSTMAGN